MIQAGLPWPDEPYVLHECRQVVERSDVNWYDNKEIRDLYEFNEPLGTGGFAKVFKGTHKESARDVAIKHITMSEEGDRDVVYKEIKHLTLLKNVQQVVSIYEVFDCGDDVYIVMELCKGGELHSSFEASEKGALTYGDVGRIAVCMLILADAMHSRGLVHCDLKPENFCLAEPLDSVVSLVDSLRLIDFGLSQRVRGGQAIAGLAGSIPYMAPEIKTRMYDHKVDIWSIGVIVYTLLVGCLPFDGRSAEEIMARASTRKPDTSSLHPAVADFVNWLLTKDPRKRPEAREALQHPWLKSTSKKAAGKDAFLQSVSDEVVQNLSIFAASNKLQRAFMHLAAGFMNKSEMQKMLAMFHALSCDQKKPLSAPEIIGLLAKGRSPEEAERVTKTVQLVMGMDGELSIEDFIVASMNQYRNLSDVVIKTMFSVLDTDNDGWITAGDAYAALQSSGVHMTVKELTKLFDKYGVKRRLGDAQRTPGIMTYHEFHELMMPSVSQRYTHELDNIVLAFKSYHGQNPFQKLARRIIAENAPNTKETERIKAAFQNLDQDGSGTLTRTELSRGIRTAGYVVSDSDLNSLFESLDTDGTGFVRYHEFVAGSIDHNILVGDHMLRWLFDYMDDDDSNTITGDNLKNMLDRMDWSESEKGKIWEAACGAGGTDCDLTFEQFKALIQAEGGLNLMDRVAAGAHSVHTATGLPFPHPAPLASGSGVVSASPGSGPECATGKGPPTPTASAAGVPIPPAAPRLTAPVSGSVGHSSRPSIGRSLRDTADWGDYVSSSSDSDDADADGACRRTSAGGRASHAKSKPLLLTKRTNAGSPELVRATSWLDNVGVRNAAHMVHTAPSVPCDVPVSVSGSSYDPSSCLRGGSFPGSMALGGQPELEASSSAMAWEPTTAASAPASPAKAVEPAGLSSSGDAWRQPSSARPHKGKFAKLKSLFSGVKRQ